MLVRVVIVAAVALALLALRKAVYGTPEAVPKKDDKKPPPRDPAREVVETVVFVVVLVLLLKLFVTEAFVIPTGSMAETLYGYQKVITCAKCDHQFPVNAHDEVEPNQAGQMQALVGYCCPNCRYQGDVGELRPEPEVRTGDRVLVLKPLYHLTQPRRGDVVVFKYPQRPQENHTAANYIKRAMGFGGETVAIHRGKLYVTRSLTYPESDNPPPDDPLDLWQKQYMFENRPHAVDLFNASRAAGFTDRVPGGFQIVRKEEGQLLADLRVVWDNDRQPTELVGVVPPRWHAVEDGPRWKADDAATPRAFQHAGEPTDWLRYQHYAWRTERGRRVPWRWPQFDEDTGVVTDPRPAAVAGPVDNMIGYNAGTDENRATRTKHPRDLKRREPTMWVGDLCLECEADLGAGAEAVLELSKGANRFQAKFGNGQVSLARIGDRGAEFGNPTRACAATAGAHKLRFANIDCRLWVWVDGKRIDFGADGDYIPVETTAFDPEDVLKEGWVRANDIDNPARVGARGAVRVSGLKLFRDIYYTRDYDRGSDQTGADIYYVQPGHYMCLGDNSAQSSDSRSWGVVPERLMLGKAVFVFWPGYPPPNRVGFIK
jgi:signal peptidase I